MTITRTALHGPLVLLLVTHIFARTAAADQAAPPQPLGPTPSARQLRSQEMDIRPRVTQSPVCPAISELGLFLEPDRAADKPPGRKIVLIAGKKSHGPLQHEYEKGCRLIKACLDASPNVKSVQTVVVTDGWPEDEAVLDDADSIFLFCDGADNGEQRHPLLQGDRLKTLGKLMDRGVGFAILHYTIFVPTNHGGKEFQNWVGGYFDYDSQGPAKDQTREKWYSKLGEAETTTTPMSTDHPILRGVKPFTTRTENYWKIRFLDNDLRLTPLLTFDPALSSPPTRESVVAWCVERKDGGRGFAYTEGHYHSHWQIDSFRKVMLNALLWTAHVDVPEGGVESTPPEELLK